MPDNVSAEIPRIADLRRRLGADPSSRVFFELAREYYDSGQLEAAADVCHRGLRHHPSYQSARVLLGRVLFDMGRIDESREAMEAVLAQVPDNLVARRVLAEICLEQGDVEGGLERYRVLLAFNPADADTKRKIETLEAKLRSAPAGARPAPASAVAASALPAAPPEPPPQHALDAVSEPFAPSPAESDGSEAGESSVLATPTLAEIYLQQGLTTKAAQVYREILKGDPTNSEALSRLAEIEKPEAPPPDPADEARHRKISVLTSWLEVIRGGARGGGDV